MEKIIVWQQKEIKKKFLNADHELQYKCNRNNKPPHNMPIYRSRHIIKQGILSAVLLIYN
jgi:hypothetical protein